MSDLQNFHGDRVAGRRRVLLALTACTALAPVGRVWAADGGAPASVVEGAPVAEVFGDLSGPACRAWMDTLRRAGWTVQAQERPPEQMPRIRRWLSVPSDSQSVWLARVGLYFVDGPVPVATLDRLWKARPALRGLTVSASGAVLQVGHDGLARPLSAF